LLAHSLCMSALRRHPPPSPLFPYTTLFRSPHRRCRRRARRLRKPRCRPLADFVKGRTMRNTFRYSFATVLTAGLVTTPLTAAFRSEEHTSELQSRFDLVCRLLLEKKNQTN